MLTKPAIIMLMKLMFSKEPTGKVIYKLYIFIYGYTHTNKHLFIYLHVNTYITQTYKLYKFFNLNQGK